MRYERYTRSAMTGTITLDQSKYAQDVLHRFGKYFKQHADRNVPMMGNSTQETWTENYGNNLTNAQLEDLASFPKRQIDCT